MSAANATFLQPLCDQIESVLASAYSQVMDAQLVLLLAVLCAIGVLARQFAKHRVSLHGNLILLFSNIVVLYMFHSLGWILFIVRYKFLQFTYKTACDLLTPSWMAAPFFGPYQAYSVAYPAFHFAVMFERVRATFMADKYENEGRRTALWMCATVWIVSLGFMAYVICAAFADPDFADHAQGVLVLTSKYNQQPIFYVTILMLLVVIFTALCDWRLYVLNKRIRRARISSSEYSLSRNYQLNENALVMRLILPLDISYALLFPIYQITVLFLRAYKQQMTTAEFSVYYNTVITLLFLHSFASIIVYIRFIKFVSKSQRRNVAEQKPEANMYFRQLASQWG